jgi:coproporphyrinogen III oxidase
MKSSLEEKKELASQWFRSLRDQFCASFEELDGGKFERKKWNHKGSGGGEISILKGEVFEKVGVNISTVAGEFSDDFKSQIKGTEKSSEYWASGISLVAHMQSPKVPAFHFNTRFLATGENWFGGGTDMTPSIPEDKETEFFHTKLKEACDKSDDNYYSKFKKTVMNISILLIEMNLEELAGYFLIT